MSTNTPQDQSAAFTSAVTPQRLGEGIADFRETAARAAEVVAKVGKIVDEISSGAKFLEIRVFDFPIQFRLKKGD